MTTMDIDESDVKITVLDNGIWSIVGSLESEENKMVVAYIGGMPSYSAVALGSAYRVVGGYLGPDDKRFDIIDDAGCRCSVPVKCFTNKVFSEEAIQTLIKYGHDRESAIKWLVAKEQGAMNDSNYGMYIIKEKEESVKNTISTTEKVVSWLTNNIGQELQIVDVVGQNNKKDVNIGLKINLSFSTSDGITIIRWSENNNHVDWEVFEKYRFKPVPKIEYTNWSAARAWMEEDGNIAKLGDDDYIIYQGGVIINPDEALEVSGFELNMLDSEEWIIIKEGE